MEPLRLAVISTPRTGNCWLRHMLAETLELAHLIVHRPDEVAWHDLPRRAILQLHWSPQPDFTSRLEEHGFRVVTNCRHPLDVLVSILAFSQHDDSTLRWLGGAVEDERSIQGASPLDEAFRRYAVGPRATSLLAVSADWWNRPGVLQVRYEQLLTRPAAELDRLLAALGATARRPTVEVVGHSTPDQMRSQNIHMLYHVWQAQAGLWRQFLTAGAARHICQAHQPLFATLGYGCDPDESLTVEAAQAAWRQFDFAALKRNLFGVKRELAEINHRNHCQTHDARAALEQHQATLAEQRNEIAQLKNLLADVRRQIEGIPLDKLRACEQLGPWSIEAAHTLHRWSGRFPRVSAGIKSVMARIRSDSSAR